MENTDSSSWKKCSSCKKPIGFGARYYVCSVSTCNGQRTGYTFCSVPCFEVHLPSARHKDAAAIEQTAPPKGAPAREPQRLIVKPAAGATKGSAPASHAHTPQEVLVIASRLKEYIAARSEMNTSAAVMDVLSDHLRRICDLAIDHARAEGRKTVMERDFEFLKKS